MSITVFENYNVHPNKKGLIYYRFVKGESIVHVSVDDKQTWTEVPVRTSIYNESDFARFIYGFQSGLAFSLK